MTEAPQLSRQDIEDEVRTLHLRPHRSRTTALRGKGEAGELFLRLTEGELRFLIEPVTCELSLRRALWREKDTPKVLLVDGVSALPHDLQARIAGGEIREVTETRRIARMFGASAVSPQLASSLIGLALLDPPQIKPAPIQGATVDLDTGLRALLAARAGLPVEGALSEERLLSFFASKPIPAAFAGQLGLEEGEERASSGSGQVLRAAVRQRLQERFGLAAGMAFEGWIRGKGPRAVGLLFVLEATGEKLQPNSYLRARVVGVCQELGGLPVQADAEKLARQTDHLKSLVARLQLRLSQENHRDVLLAVLNEADRLLPEPEARRELEGSAYLPGSFERGMVQVGQNLALALSSNVKTVPLTTCRELLEKLSQHALASEPSRRERLDRCRMAARLVAWLATDPQAAADAATMGGVLAVEAGRVEEALQGSAGLPEGALRDTVEKARQLAKQTIAQLEADFAKLTEGPRAAQPGDPLPPEDILGRVVMPFLADHPWRKVVVVVVPGLRWADAHQLLETLEREAQPSQGLLRFRGATGTSEDSPLPLPPLLGGALTGHEIRSRILAGRKASAGQILEEARDPSRFADHEGLRGVAGTEVQRYFPAADAFLPEGGLKESLLNQLASPARILAVSLREHTSHGQDLLDLLTRASESGRATLVVSCGAGAPGDPAGAGVLPLLLLGSSWLETLADEGCDEPLKVQPPPRPPFWQLELPAKNTGKPGTKTPAKATTKNSKTKGPVAGQLSLPGEDNQTSLRPRLEKVFGSGEHLHAQTFALVELLYKAGGNMAVEDLARKLNVLIPRVAGFVAKASEYVSKDGYEFLSYDHPARMAKLDKQLLDQFLQGVTS
jgi:hypothetical protein